MGHMVIMPEELGKLRCAEAQAAGKVMGYHVIYGGFHDLDIYDDKESRIKVSEIIREIRPDFIITHSPNDYMPDHNATSKLVFDASFCASIPHFPSKFPACNVVPIYYMKTSAGVNFVPEFFVDITEEFEQKKKAFLCHETQVKWLSDHTGKDTTAALEAAAASYGHQCGVKYAEVFAQCKVSLKVPPVYLLP